MWRLVSLPSHQPVCCLKTVKIVYHDEAFDMLHKIAFFVTSYYYQWSGRRQPPLRWTPTNIKTIIRNNQHAWCVRQDSQATLSVCQHFVLLIEMAPFLEHRTATPQQRAVPILGCSFIQRFVGSLATVKRIIRICELRYVRRTKTTSISVYVHFVKLSYGKTGCMMRVICFEYSRVNRSKSNENKYRCGLVWYVVTS